MREGRELDGTVRFQDLDAAQSAALGLTRDRFAPRIQPSPTAENKYEQRFDPYGEYLHWHDYITNPIGRFCNQGAHVLTDVLKPVVEMFGNNDTASVARFARKWWYSAMAYTPYFGMKTSVLIFDWDTPRMNMALDRMLGGIWHLNKAEFKAGLTEVLRDMKMVGHAFPEAKRERDVKLKMRGFRNQLWASEDELIQQEEKALLKQEEVLEGAAGANSITPASVKPFATENLKREIPQKKSLTATQLLPRQAIETIKPREASYQQELSARN